MQLEMQITKYSYIWLTASSSKLSVVPKRDNKQANKIWVWLQV